MTSLFAQLVQALNSLMPAKESDDPLIVLISVARQDQQMARRLIAVLKQDQFNRHSLLNTWIHELSLQSAPKSFIDALASLLDDELAKRALDILRSDQPIIAKE